MRNRRRSFGSDFSRTQAHEIDRGMYHSSVCQHQLGEVIRLELETRAQSILTALREVLGEGAPDADSANELKALVAELLDEHAGDLRAKHVLVVGIMPNTQAGGAFDQHRNEALAKAESDIDVAALAATRSYQRDAGNADPVLQLKPQLYGIGIDLKALCKRLKVRLSRSGGKTDT